MVCSTYGLVDDMRADDDHRRRCRTCQNVTEMMLLFDIEPSRGFVQQQNCWVAYEGTRQAEAAASAPRQLRDRSSPPLCEGALLNDLLAFPRTISVR